MTVTTWIVPRIDIPSAGSGGGSGYTFVPSPGGTPLSALQQNKPSRSSVGVDRLLDPVTLNYVRTESGEWAETADSRTTVLIALSIRLGASAYDPDQGTSRAERIKSGSGLTPEFLRSDTERIGAQLARAGVLSDLRVTTRDVDGAPLRDEADRLAVRLEWRDLSSGAPASITVPAR